jgi:hypothetical protein
MSADGSPTRPRFSSIQVVESEDSLVLIWQTINPAFVFVALAIFGSVICFVPTAWAYNLFREPLLIVAGVTIWVVWICAVGVITGRVRGFERLTLSPEGLAIERNGFFPISARCIPLEELRRIRVRKFRSQSDSPDPTGIEIVTLGRSFKFGLSLSTLERDWIADRMERMLAELQKPEERDDREDDPIDCRDCDPPSDSAWVLDPDPEILAFRQTGRRHVGGLVAATFLNLMWNGVISIFVCGLLGLLPADHAMNAGEWWLTFLFLIPFEAAGLVLLAAFVLELLEPVRVTRWTIGPDSIEHATTRLGLPLGLRHVYAAEEMRFATVRDDLGAPRWPMARQAEDGAHFGVLLIDEHNREVCSIRQLTLGEARWMKGMLQEHGRAAIDLSAPPPLPRPSATASSSAIRPGR